MGSNLTVKRITSGGKQTLEFVVETNSVDACPKVNML